MQYTYKSLPKNSLINTDGNRYELENKAKIFNSTIVSQFKTLNSYT